MNAHRRGGPSPAAPAAKGRRRLAVILATAAFACIGGTVAASALGGRWAEVLAVAAVALLVAALAVVRGRGQS